MGPIALTCDVTAALPGELTRGQTIAISAWLFVPDNLAALGDMPVVMTLLSGGSYDKRYHHAVIPGHPGYSAAEHLAAQGIVVILADHLGTGESSRLPDQKQASPQVVARAMHAAMAQVHDAIRAGTLEPALPPLPRFARIGGGHSMGAMMTVFQQAGHRTYDAIMVLGYTAKGVHFVFGGHKVRAADHVPTCDVPDYSENDRAAQRQNFHWPDVPEAVMLADDALAVPTPSRIGLDSIRTGIIAAEAAQIDVPVLFGQGEQDVSPDPHGEAACFDGCGDFTLYILPRSAHCQTFAGTRHRFWDRMAGWAQTIAIEHLRASAQPDLPGCLGGPVASLKPRSNR